MPLDRSIKKVLVIGAGPIVIGQGCEFDYSGTQACQALKEEGCKVILLNSNPATIMTDSSIADAVYIEPIASEIIEKIILMERPDSLLPTMGGQTALNCAKKIAVHGLLKKYGVNLIGLTLETIEKAEDRKRFKEEVMKRGLEVPRSFCVASLQEAIGVQKWLGFPLIVRCSFTLGGQGGGVAYDLKDLERICQEAFSVSEELLIEESLIGWKEYELEVMRDRKGNSIVVCGIENVDPMGVHTGDSITVTPIQTLTDKEYQLMRKRAFQVMEVISMISGGCNVQFAVNPRTGRMLCIEVNPRVSRSSALASKATGYPIAKIAAKLALGYHLDELKIDGHSFLPAFFEPVIDYVVTKLPRFSFEKFPQANPSLSTHMKSVGEVMAIGRTFTESLNKALSSLDIPVGEIRELAALDVRNKLKTAHYQRLACVFEALRHGIPVEEVHALTKYDPWFLEQLAILVKEEEEVATHFLNTVDFGQMYRWKQRGFSDEKLAHLLKCQPEQVAERRKKLNVHPVYKRIDGCSGEFSHELPYLYSTYEEECESFPTAKKKVIMLGSGPNRIGQGIEFDYCCVHAVKAIRDLGYESIMINCNPETVSTDYDRTDRLYFEPLTAEHVSEVIRTEKPVGTIIQFGGQTSLNIGKYLQKEGVALLGTSFDFIDLTEDRKKFRLFAERMGFKQPENEIFSSEEEAFLWANKIGFPLILRPSYVLGGHAIQVIRNEDELRKYLLGVSVELIAPVLMEKFLEGAMEVEVDAIGDGHDVYICGIIEQVEPTGIHSGDSMSFLSPYQMNTQCQDVLIEQTRKIGQSLKMIGLFNVQFAIYHNDILVLEVNPRASRTVPLLSKTTGLSLVQIATKCILGQTLKEQGLGIRAEPKFLGLKLPVFPFSRLHVKDESLGPQMKSTGEVLCIGKTFQELFTKARLYASQDKCLFTRDLEAKLPRSNIPILDVYNIKTTKEIC